MLVSWDDRGAAPVAKNQGDALIWTGVALASVPCESGRGLAAAIIETFNELGGGLWRHPTLRKLVSMDGAIGTYRGIAERTVRCGEGPTVWRPIFAQHLAYMRAHGGRLNESANVILEAGWTYVRDLLAWELELGAKPSDEDRQGFEHVVGDWAGLVKTAHVTGIGSDACWRVNVGLLAFQTVERLGVDISQEGRDLFCANTEGFHLPTTDQWCGRTGLEDFNATWRDNVWQYRHQRCAAWESPDGDGLWQPGVDWARGLADFYTL